MINATRLLTAMVVSLGLVSMHGQLVYASSGSLWQGETIKSSSYFVDKNGPDLAINDIVVILIEEKVTASTDADTEAEIEDTLSGEVSNWFSIENAADLLKIFKLDFEGIGDVQTHQNSSTGLPKWGIEIKNSFEGEGETTRNNTVVAKITARVVGMEPNGNIVLEGQREIKVNAETTTLKVTGVARKKDVSEENTVLSSQIYDLKFMVSGRGVVDGVNRRGLISYIIGLVR